jgi:hypothetical protein
MSNLQNRAALQAVPLPWWLEPVELSPLPPVPPPRLTRFKMVVEKVKPWATVAFLATLAIGYTAAILLHGTAARIL